MYYSDEDLEEDIASAPFGDDRLVGGHALANTPVPPFWIQEGNGDQDTQWRDCDPLFGTAFISPRLLSTHIGLFDGIGRQNPDFPLRRITILSLLGRMETEIYLILGIPRAEWRT